MGENQLIDSHNGAIDLGSQNKSAFRTKFRRKKQMNKCIAEIQGGRGGLRVRKKGQHRYH